MCVKARAQALELIEQHQSLEALHTLHVAPMVVSVKVAQIPEPTNTFGDDLEAICDHT